MGSAQNVIVATQISYVVAVPASPTTASIVSLQARAQITSDPPTVGGEHLHRGVPRLGT